MTSKADILELADYLDANNFAVIGDAVPGQLRRLAAFLDGAPVDKGRVFTVGAAVVPAYAEATKGIGRVTDVGAALLAVEWPDGSVVVRSAAYFRHALHGEYRVGATVEAVKDLFVTGSARYVVKAGTRGVIAGTGNGWPWRVRFDSYGPNDPGSLVAEDEIKVVD